MKKRPRVISIFWFEFKNLMARVMKTYKKLMAWVRKKRPLVFSIFWLTVILGALYPIILFIRGWVNYSSIHLLEINPHTPQTDISWFAWIRLTLGFKDSYAAIKAFFFWLLGVLPAAFALWHFRTIELVHRCLHPDDIPPSVIPIYEQTPSLADHADRSPPPITWLNGLRLIGYHSYRIWKWFWGIIANPTFGTFLRVVLVKLPDPWNSWILNRIWDQVRRFLSWIIGIIGEILREVLVKLPDLWISRILNRNWVRFWGIILNSTFGAFLRDVPGKLPNSWIPGNLYRIWGCFRGYLTWIIGAVLRVVLVALTLSPAILLFVIWLLWPLIFQSWTSILTHINLNLSPTMLFMFFCLLTIFYISYFFEVFFLLLNTEKIFKRAQIYVELCHLLESSGKKEEIRAAMEKQVRKHEGEQSLHSINRESLFEVFNAQEKIENYFRVQQELPEFKWNHCLRFFFKHVALGMPLPPDDNRNTIKRLNPKFLCRVKVKSGFLSPTYLVSGLLSEFDENWQLIVRNYGLDMDWKKDPMLRGKGVDDKSKLLKLRKLQSFIWMCWIQWGPSIPIHGSKKNWKSGSIGLQYGYGDENNSLPLFLKDNHNTEKHFQWTQLKDHYREWQNEDPNVASSHERSVVIPTSLTAELVWVKPRENAWNVCNAQKKNEPFLALEANLNTEFNTSNIQHNWHESRMYSAYIWVIFAVCVKKPENCRRKGEKKVFPDLIFPWDESESEAETAREKQAWRGLIPFFQHGNIAEPTVYESIKKELAYKTLQALKEYLDPKVQLKEERILEISFACAFDENGDGSPSDPSTPALALQHGKTIRGYMDSELKTTYQGQDWTNRLHLDEHAVPQITSCRMPEIVEQYFQSIRSNSLSHDELYDENHWRDLRDLTEETDDEKSLREKILNRADELCKSVFLSEEEREGHKQLRERLLGEKTADAPKTHFLVFGKDLDAVSKCKVLGCLVIEWFPNSECGRFSDLVVDPDFRRQGIARELIWRGAEILRKYAKVSGKELKVFAEITDPEKRESYQDSMPPKSRVEAFKRLGAEQVANQNDTQPSSEASITSGDNLMRMVFELDRNKLN